MSNYKDTVHRVLTKFGFKTPHKFPSSPTEVKSFSDLADQLYPTGRAWRIYSENNIGKIHEAINETFLDLREEGFALINSVIPDNPYFTNEDCLFWEGKLGIISNSNLTIEQRRNIILNKLSFPRNIKARQSMKYIEKQLHLNGFTEVRVYANIFYNPNGTHYYMSPQQLSQQAAMVVQHGGNTQHSNSTQHGDANVEVIANSVNDENYSIGGNENLWATFFIASPISVTEKGFVPNSRKKEFKELVLKLKPANTVAFTLINYI